MHTRIIGQDHLTTGIEKIGIPDIQKTKNNGDILIKGFATKMDVHHVHALEHSLEVVKTTGDGDWQALMLVQEARLDEYHDYSVEWAGDDLIFRLDEVEVYRLQGEAKVLPEPFFAILNFAKINDSAMTQNWVMEVDWVKHDYWQ